MDYKSFPFELLEAKAVGDGWEFSGYLSTFSNLDAAGDVVLSGAFDRTLKERDFRPLLWGHEHRSLPIGVEKSLTVDDRGLLGTWGLIDTATGTDAYKALKAGAVRSMSMGYQAIDAEFRDDGVRLLRDVELLEASLVNLPANDQAEVTRVKELIDSDVPFDQLLGQITEWLEKGAAEAEALAARRAEDERRSEDKRKLSDVHVAAIKSLLESAGAVSGRLEALIAGPPKSEPAMNLRLELARRRLAQRGILEHAS